MAENGHRKVGCVIMASGLGKRFGRNKLLEPFRGRSLIQRVLELTEEEAAGCLFDRRIVVTRSEEVRELCERQNVEVLFHQMPDRSDAVRLGISAMEEMDGCLFCPCDQPLLQRESIQRIVWRFREKGTGILRLAWKEQQGAPVLFGREYFEELKCLPKGRGGSYLVKRYPDQVETVSAQWEAELYDCDTQEDLARLLRMSEEIE